MTETTLPLEDDRRAKRNVIVLVLAQALLGAQMAMIFVVGGLAGQSLASNVCFATLPISLIVLGSMISANPLSMVMQRFGRKAGFLIGAMGGAAGGEWPKFADACLGPGAAPTGGRVSDGEAMRG